MFEIGNSLLEARSRQGLELSQLEAETRIRAKYLRALEEENFDVLPGEAYARGFLRVYAERLGLDPQVYVDEYDARFSAAADPPPRKPRRLASQRRRRIESHGLIIALAAIVVLTGLVIAAWRFGDVTGDDEPAAEPPAAEQPALTPPPVEVEPPPPALAPTPTPVEPPPPPPAAPGEAKLVIVAVDGGSGVVVREPNRRGVIVFGGTMAEGDRQEFSGTRLHVVIDRPEALAVEVNDEAISPLPPAPAAFVVTTEGVEEVRAR